MFDETVFTNFMMDMATLEATMTVYDYEHGLTPEYLASVDEVSYDDDATESAVGTFVDGLFENDFAPATEGFKETMGNIGKGIKTAMITIIGAIKKAFVTLGNNISSFFNKAIEKHQRESAKKDPYIRALLMNDSVRACATTTTKAFKALTMAVSSANVQILPIVNKINKALNSAGIGNKAGATASKDDLAEVGKNFSSSYGSKNMLETEGTDKNKQVKMGIYNRADEDITISEKILEMLAKALQEMQKLISSKDDEIESTIEKVVKAAGDNSKFKGTNVNAQGEEKETKFEKKASPALVQKAIFMNVDVSSMQAMAKQVTSACSQHAKACDGISKNVDSASLNDNPNAKRGYRLCQIYMKASKYFSQISMLCSKVLSFKATDVKKLGEIE